MWQAVNLVKTGLCLPCVIFALNSHRERFRIISGTLLSLHGGFKVQENSAWALGISTGTTFTLDTSPGPMLPWANRWV